jgi:hypothetical protein
MIMGILYQVMETERQNWNWPQRLWQKTVHGKLGITLWITGSLDFVHRQEFWTLVYTIVATLEIQAATSITLNERESKDDLRRIRWHNTILRETSTYMKREIRRIPSKTSPWHFTCDLHLPTSTLQTSVTFIIELRGRTSITTQTRIPGFSYSITDYTGQLAISKEEKADIWTYLTLILKNGVFWDVTSHGATFQKTPFFIVTAVKTSNLTSDSEVFLIQKFSLQREINKQIK